MEFDEVLNRRYSCRAFASRGVEQEIVDRILEAGRIAPTAVLIVLRPITTMIAFVSVDSIFFLLTRR